MIYEMMLSKLVETDETKREQKSVDRLIDGWMEIRLDRVVVARLVDFDGRVMVVATVGTPEAAQKIVGGGYRLVTDGSQCSQW